jgi:hypothetical protein
MSDVTTEGTEAKATKKAGKGGSNKMVSLKAGNPAKRSKKWVEKNALQNCSRIKNLPRLILTPVQNVRTKRKSLFEKDIP